MDKIKKDEYYTPNELVSMRVAKSRQMILRHIRQDKIKSKNLGSDKKPRYIVLGKDFIKYSNTQMRAGEYITK